MNFTQILLGVGAIVALGKKRVAPTTIAPSGSVSGPRGRQLVIVGTAHAAAPVGGSAISPSAGRSDLPTAGTGKTLPITMTGSPPIIGGLARSAEEGIKSAYAETMQIQKTIMLVAKTLQQLAEFLKSFQALSSLLASIAKIIATYATAIAIAIEVVLEVVRGMIASDAESKVMSYWAGMGFTSTIEQFVRNVNGVEKTLMYGRSEMGLYGSDWPDNEAGLLSARMIGLHYATELDILFGKAKYGRPQELWGVPVADAFGFYPGVLTFDFDQSRIEGLFVAQGDTFALRHLTQMQYGTSMVASPKYKIAAKDIAASGLAAIRGLWGRRWVGSILQWTSQFDMVFDTAYQASTPLLPDPFWLSLIIGTPRRGLPMVNTANDLEQLADLSFGVEGAEKLRNYGRALARGYFLAKGAIFFNRGIITYLVYPGDEEFTEQFRKVFSNVVPTRVVGPGVLEFDGGRVNVTDSNKKLEPRFILWR